MANSSLGTFKVRHVVDLIGCPDRLAMCLLMHKAGAERDRPALVSFDARSLMPSTEDSGGGVGEAWSLVGDAALTSIEPLMVLEDHLGSSDYDWFGRVASRCAFLGFNTPQIQVSKPAGPMEPKIQQWNRLRPSCLMHCTAEEAQVASWVRQGSAVLRSSGIVALPPPVQDGPTTWPPVVVLDRCNSEKIDRRQWIQMGNLKKTEVIAVHLDVDENECVTRVTRRGDQHPTRKVSSLTQAASVVTQQSDRFEAPSEREGFKSVIRIQGSAALAQELVRRWTEECPLESDNSELRRAMASNPSNEEDEEEAPPPALAQLSQWIEVEEQGMRSAMWGSPFGGPVDAPLEGL
ncbi:unnamed protein product, partial [Polarella glacialis]